MRLGRVIGNVVSTRKNPPAGAGSFVNYDATADGQRFVFVQPLEEVDDLRRIRVVQNWFEELREQVPIP